MNTNSSSCFFLLLFYCVLREFGLSRSLSPCMYWIGRVNQHRISHWNSHRMRIVFCLCENDSAFPFSLSFSLHPSGFYCEWFALTKTDNKKFSQCFSNSLRFFFVHNYWSMILFSGAGIFHCWPASHSTNQPLSLLFRHFLWICCGALGELCNGLL